MVLWENVLPGYVCVVVGVRTAGKRSRNRGDVRVCSGGL